MTHPPSAEQHEWEQLTADSLWRRGVTDEDAEYRAKSTALSAWSRQEKQRLEDRSLSH